MPHFEATSRISAVPAAVWTVLIDAGGWPRRHSGIDGAERQIAPGAARRIRSKGAPGRAFPVAVTTFEPARPLTFPGGMPRRSFTGVRTHALTPHDAGGTDFTVREEHTGLLLGPVWRSMPDLGPSSTQFADGLKRRVKLGT